MCYLLIIASLFLEKKREMHLSAKNFHLLSLIGQIFSYYTLVPVCFQLEYLISLRQLLGILDLMTHSANFIWNYQ